MLREALRRLLWLGPTLLVVTVPTFWAVSKLASDAPTAGGEPAPLFFNDRPLGSSERAVAAATRVAAGDAEAARTLSRLGGAALPHVIPLLDSLRPEARGRVALSLAPIAHRMGISAARDVDSPEAAVRFWTQFWEEHAIDFRSSVVRRTVRRFAEHPSPLRRAEVSDLDTMALEDLLDAMRPLRTAEDVIRVRQVCDAAAHVTELPWTVPDAATVLSARRVVARWETFWLEHQTDYIALAGARRLTATLLETRYGRWAARLGHRELGALANGRSVASVLRARGRPTVFLLLSALLVGYPLGVLLATVSFVFRRKPAGLVLHAGTLAVAALSALGLASGLSTLAQARLPSALVTMALGSAAVAAWPARGLQERLSELPHVRTELALGASPLRVAIRQLRLALPSYAALAVGDLPGLFSAAFVVERVYSLHGLGEPTIEAIRSGDPAFLMALALGSALALGIAQIGLDLVHSALDPRLRLGRRPSEEST